MKPYALYAFADEADKNIDGQIAAMLRNGLQGLEVRNVDGINVSRITLEKAREVRKKLDDNGLIIWSIGSPIGKVRLEADWNEHLDKFRHTLEVAHILGAKNLRLFSFYMEQAQMEANRQQVIDRLGQFLQIAEGSDVALCHENEKGIFGATAEGCLAIHHALPQMKGIFDPANFVQCGVDTLQAWVLLKGYTYYLHIKDALPDGSVVPSGKGHGNVEYIVRDYLARGGSAMTIEPHLTVFDGLKELEQAGDATKILYQYPDKNTAFDTACAAIKDILREV